MPHCIIEYSQELAQELDIKALMSCVFLAATQSALFSKGDIKVRAISYKDFYAEIENEANNKQRFMHVCCKILSGRHLEQRQKLSELVLSQLNTFAIKSVSISVEIVDMERESYNKRVS
ncbi:MULTISPECIES: 5-carboxymethyl-2-hydroxymuconate Delta-isomerase [unclassified Colwellia]|uniref:5-carboxymethyl-2-hydroxymuconate Delta-isomerase n=1 Tax=unclassified Colwellia TaxID=196834 RepID=UPI0015F541F8|nr:MULTISPECIES: 5-carboxymethyl-2-hydroxymuconate Delta-isomerase [unclassified Colwellia]MBA6231491.1 5-carboxymethyl-2-hydroxymuconate Delta-isomerase [Colwellia sp. MB02u-7]MBA6238418.1 5-carboxymethyl-2-hydroxymuconate Delta-isomerase [Colwellia sp. MB02u-11]MBA6255192.1 5-carboxymethyl-2-hydroxymuconate Delta-isomerase [Colwellia sp. MB3u-28]MBA6260767.1 5-carboxymethyl-2-hydroxymuconate Delta-isomerase [Colwellia sp. MB3u-41]MBA6299624.1 5-carboxymethyl-2-hydroxymuconate Delta-isomerase